MKKRLDVRMVEQGLVSGRDRARGFIMAGQVYVDNQKAVKPGMEVGEGSAVELRGETLRYVGRGGLKLEKALEMFPLGLTGKICMDVGASTGGFTDCMLQNGASRVYAVDVGYGQLAWKLRQDERVVVLERVNIRDVTEEQVPEPIDFAGIDVSFISLTLVLPVVERLLREGGEAVCLIKPQFEAGREKVGKKGVVRDPVVHLEVSEKIAVFATKHGFAVMGFTWSPIRGPEGNIEYLMHLRKTSESSAANLEEIRRVVELSHKENL